jgi:hypothetical protein
VEAAVWIRPGIEAAAKREHAFAHTGQSMAAAGSGWLASSPGPLLTSRESSLSL